MRKEILATGKDVELAVNNAIIALGVSSLDEISYEIVDLGSRGIFGIGARPTKVKAWIDLPDTVAPRQHGPAENAVKPRENRENAKKSEGNAEAPRENRDRHGRNRRGNRRRSDGMAPPRDFVAPTEPAKPREAVIPESELKMEPVTVAPGEDLSFDFVKQLVENIGLDATVSLFHCEDNTRRIVISGEEASVLIGHHGDALDSLQYLANLASAKKNANGERNRRRVTIDIEGYRAKREETLRALARKMAGKALRQHRSVMLEPMTAYERRIIHSEIQGMEGVSTNSIGSDNNRKIVIYLTDAPKTAPVEDEVEEETVTLFETETVTEEAEEISEPEAEEDTAAEEAAETANADDESI